MKRPFQYPDILPPSSRDPSSSSSQVSSDQLHPQLSYIMICLWVVLWHEQKGVAIYRTKSVSVVSRITDAA
jgi:hypothetical protein